MKNLQTLILKIILVCLISLSFGLTYAQSSEIKKADSLFRSKQYTQSIEIYKSILQEKKYSQAMLLKMAYIEEGLGKIGSTLYYLKLYYLASSDEQAQHKIEELAAKFNLTGYSNETNHLKQWIDKNQLRVLAGLSGLLLIVSAVLFLQRKKSQPPWLATTGIVLISGFILYFNNSATTNSVIVGNGNAYLMEGPSAGAPVATILSEGNQLESLGAEDVWLKVKWNDKVVYVKENAVLKVAL